MLKYFYFGLNIVFWYGFTIASTVYSKIYLNGTNDPHTLTLITFLYGSCFALVKYGLSSFKYFHPRQYVYLALFNIATTLMTNIGMNITSVSLTYMIKASEPLFVLILSYFILEELLESKVHITLIPICVGVSLIVIGEMKFSLLGIISVFLANLSSASRNVFYKLKLNEANNDEATKPSSLMIYLNVSIVSFIIYLPAYCLRIGLSKLGDSGFTYLSQNQNYEIDLVLGSLFNFLYNLFSFQVLSNISPISHSVINIMKRVFIVFGSLIIFSSKITLIQFFGMMFADLGVFMYSYLKLRSKSVKITISNLKKKIFIKTIISIIVIIVYGSFFLNFNIFIEKEINVENNISEIKRIECLNKIKFEIINSFKKIIPQDKTAHVLDVPFHFNYGDTLIWLGEEELLKQLNINVFNIITDRDSRLKNNTYLNSTININDTILMHGGGNFGDLYRFNPFIRNQIIKWFPNNLIIFMPQTINYRNNSYAEQDKNYFNINKKLIITVRSFDSYEYALNWFPDVKTFFVPDMAFVLGNIKPLKEPSYDILILRRTDSESKYGYDVWDIPTRDIIDGKYSYLIIDWFNYKKNQTNDPKIFGPNIMNLMNEIISQGRVIVTDRLHASIFSLLIGRPHVILEEKYKKIYNTRESAFNGKEECQSKYITGYYTYNPNEALNKAVEILKTFYFINETSY